MSAAIASKALRTLGTANVPESAPSQISVSVFDRSGMIFSSEKPTSSPMPSQARHLPSLRFGLKCFAVCGSAKHPQSSQNRSAPVGPRHAGQTGREPAPNSSRYRPSRPVRVPTVERGLE